jgi:UDP-N-acetylmuramyl tripeptide synthase
MLAGVTSALLSGGSADWAVLEADELSTIRILPQLQPDYLVLLNLFRDQLDRAGEIDHVQDTLVEALASSPRTALVVCGDDPLSWSVALRAQAAGTRVLAFGIAEDLRLAPDRVPEARFCQKCGAELDYVYRTYAQLGDFCCPACGFSRPQLEFAATDVHVDASGVSFELARAGRTLTRIQAGFGGTYMVYNLMAAAAAVALAGAGTSALLRAIEGFDPHNGRLQHFVVGGRNVVLNLAKNPTGLNQNISLMLADGRPKAVFVVVNDNGNDGRDVSWIWDVDFERLAGHEDVVEMLAGGLRANDVQVRLKYAEMRANIATSVADALAQVAELPEECVLYVLANYSALAPARAELEGMERHHG